MKGDFTRKTFRKEKHYRKVNMQQGRVQLDADWNEQVDIHLHHLSSFIQDIIGKCGTPIDNAGFKILRSSGNDYEIKAGHYYVDGILCENEVDVYASKQTDLPSIDEYLFRWNEVPGDDTIKLRNFLVQRLGKKWKSVRFRKTDSQKIMGRTSKGELLHLTLDDRKNKVILTINEELLDEFNVKERDVQIIVYHKRSPALPSEQGTYITYLDVWERHLTALEDPEILEPALGGPDTATRTKVVWQVKVQQINTSKNLFSASNNSWKKRYCCTPSLPEPGKMRARSKKDEPSNRTNIIPPERGYQGLENQLYRVEIHNPGKLNREEKPTFKWSRDNGCVVAKVSDISTDKITFRSILRDQTASFSRNQWVEVTDDRHELWGIPGTLVKLCKVKQNELFFDKDIVLGEALTNLNYPQKFNPKVRRWDGPKGLRLVEIPSEDDGYLPLEEGVEVQFEKAFYRTGDYWLIPTRTAITDIMWPRDEEGPKPLHPKGIKHHLCPLAMMSYSEGGLKVISDCRQFFPTITSCIKPNIESDNDIKRTTFIEK